MRAETSDAPAAAVNRCNPQRLLHSCILWLPLLLLVRWLGCVNSLCMPPHVAVTGLHVLLLAVATRGGANGSLYAAPPPCTAAGGVRHGWQV